MKHSEYFENLKSARAGSRRIGRISCAVLLASAVSFSGCLSRPPLNTQTFTFSTPALPANNEQDGGRVLGIRTLQIAPPFDGRSLVYRTGEFSFDRDPYAEFLGSPSECLVSPVTALLRGGGCFSAVVEAGSAVKPDALIEINIDQLYGDIRKPESPCAVLAMQVVFLNATNGLAGDVILQRNYSRTIPIRSTTSDALMAGWDRALVEIFAEVSSDFRHQVIEVRRP